MSPILGIYASQISGHLFAPSGAYDSIATTTVGAGGSSSITFSSIPSGYTHLQVRYLARTARVATGDTLKLQINSDSGANYNGHYLYGNGTSALAGSYGASSGFYYAGALTAASSTSNTFAGGVIDLLDYADTNKFKTGRILSGNDMNTTDGTVFFTSGLWRSTSAITSITLTNDSATNFAQYSQFALYGVKGQ